MKVRSDKMSWKEQIRQCYREAICTGDLYAEQEAIIEVVEALIKETEQRIIKEFEIIHKAGWFVEDTDFEDDIIPLIKGVE
jgi:predicted nucleic-acid-binding protein